MVIKQKKAAEQPAEPGLEKETKHVKKPKQTTLANMPEPDAVGKAAEKYLDAIDDVDDAKHRKTEEKKNLIDVMRKHRRMEITVRGVTFEVEHKLEQWDLKAKRPKRKNK